MSDLPLLPQNAPVYLSQTGPTWLILTNIGPVVGGDHGDQWYFLDRTDADITADAQAGLTWRPLRSEDEHEARLALSQLRHWWLHNGHRMPIYDRTNPPQPRPEWLSSNPN